MFTILIETGYYPHTFDVTLSYRGQIFTEFGLSAMRVHEKLRTAEKPYKIEADKLVRKMLKLED